jgi:hypothetical protein
MEQIKKRLSFEEWLEMVDAEVWSRAGCSYSDLSDWNYADAFEDGMRPKTAARKAIKADSEF